MKNQKKTSRIIRFVHHKSKGIISILLAVVFIPFMFLGTTLVELVRYNSTARAVDQSLALSELSVLADYDPYLMERFGLLAIDSENVDEAALSASVKTYLDLQKTTDMSGASITDVSAAGINSLNDPKIMQQQIQSYAAVLAPYDMTVNGLEIDKMIKQIDDLFLKANCLDSMLKMIQSGSDVIDSEATMFEKIDSLNDELTAVKDANRKYDESYTSWKDSVNALIEHLNNEPDRDDYKKKNPDGTESFDESAYNSAMDDWNSTKDDLIKDAEDKRDKYAEAIGETAAAMEKLSSAVDEVNTAMTGFADKIEAFGYSALDYEVAANNKAIDDKISGLKEQAKTAGEEDAERIQQQITALNNTKDVNSNSSKIAKEIDTNTKETETEVRNVMTSLDTGVINLLKTKLDNEKEKVAGYSVSGVSSGSSEPSEEDYHSAQDLNKYTPDLLQTLKDQATEALSSNLLEQVKGLVKAMRSLFKMDGVYSVGLDVNIQEGVYNALPSRTEFNYSEPDFMSGDREKSDAYKTAMGLNIEGNVGNGDDVTRIENEFQAVVDSLQEFVDKSDKLSDDLTGGDDPITKFVKFLNNLKEVICATVTLMQNTVTLIADVVSHPGAIATMFERKAVLMDYLIKTLPNRTNYTSGTTLTGYKYSKIGLPDANTASQFVQYAGGVGFASSALYAPFSGRQESCFSGAELEYVLAGCRNEIANQSIVFGWLYVFRLICDIAPVLTNTEVQNISNALSAVPYAGPFLKIIYIVATVFTEPLVDCLILVNGGDVQLVKIKNSKSFVYLTPSGIIEFAKEMTTVKIAGITSQTDGTAQKIREQTNKDITNLQKQWSENTGESYTPVPAFSNPQSAPEPKRQGFDKFAHTALDDINKLSYTEHLYILMLLLGNTDKYTRRTADIVQMEKILKGDDSYLINYSYTGVRAEAKGSLVQVFPIPSLSSSSVLSFDRVVYRGY